MGAQNGRLGEVDLNFNGWGNKQAHDDDMDVAGLINEIAESIDVSLVGEGGGIEVDSHGTAIRRRAVSNDNRNPRLNKRGCERILAESLGLDRVTWLPGLRGQDITEGHTDFYTRFFRPGLVVAGMEVDSQSTDYRVTREHLN